MYVRMGVIGGGGLQPVPPQKPDRWAEVASRASRRETVGISLEELISEQVKEKLGSRRKGEARPGTRPR